MKAMKRFYYWLRMVTSRPQERGELAAGYWQNKIRETVFKSYGQNSGCVLEIGCGEGLFLYKVLKNNPQADIRGVDISSEKLLKAKKRLNLADDQPAKLLQADAFHLPFKDNIFSVIICINVIYNIPSEDEIDKLFREMIRVSKPDGRIIFDIRNSLNPFIYIKNRLVRFYDETMDVEHLRMYTLAAIKQKLESQGLAINKKIEVGFPKGKFVPIIIIETIIKK